jgi:hypothetical protein
MAIRTVFVMAEDCKRGEPRGWEQFVRGHGWIAAQLLARYFPTLAPEAEQHLAAVFQRAHAGDAAWFRGLTFTNEREFAMAFRELVFACGREAARLPLPDAPLEELQAAVTKSALMERAILWLQIKGYDAPQIAAILDAAAATAAAAASAVSDPLSAVLPSAPDARALAARSLIEAAEKARSEDCLPLKTFNNLVSGQLTWRERELAEEHIRPCLYCLDRFTAFQEMIRYLRDVRPLPDSQVGTLLAALGLSLPKRGILGRIFS